ncbi:MAG: GlxA family transcriptional regulator [Pseudomonadota bacterium]
MADREQVALSIFLVVTPRFNLAATMVFLDPLRIANYLNGRPLYEWSVLSVAGGLIESSNGLALPTGALSSVSDTPDIALVSSSWTPEANFGPPLDAQLRRWARFGAALGGIDTGAFILAEAGLLSGRRATVHYEHLDAFAELYADVEASEDLYTFDDDRLTSCGGAASADLALQLVRATHGEALANATARYFFHNKLRAVGTRQNPDISEPVGATAPSKLRAAIKIMERHLEEPTPIPEIAAEVGLSQRQLERLFTLYVCKSPLQYYRDIRLDRARGLITQTEMPVWEVALACGFSSPEHFSRAYRARFGLPPRTDRIEGRVPFEFRAWPMHALGDRRP